MPKLNTFAAIHQAIAEELERDARVIMFGEGVATKRADLVQAFGNRVRNTPLAEAIIAGTAAGAAATGLRPVIDLLFAPFHGHPGLGADLRGIHGAGSLPLVRLGCRGAAGSVTK